MYTYYMTQRPPCPGAQPRNGLTDIRDLDPDEIIPSIGKGAYAVISYNRPLTDSEIRSYELTPTDTPQSQSYKGYQIVWSVQDHGFQIIGKRSQCIAIVDSVQEAKEGIDSLD